MRRKIYMFGAVVLIAVAVLGIGKLFYHEHEPPCPAPLMHLPNANVNVCIQPNVSMFYLTFDKEVNLGSFTDVVLQVPGIDIRNCQTGEGRKVFRLVYYMSETNGSKFLANLVAVIDDPKLFN